MVQLIKQVCQCPRREAFSMLRRLNRWLRSKHKLQILDICNEHQDILDYIDDNKLIK